MKNSNFERKVCLPPSAPSQTFLLENKLFQNIANIDHDTDRDHDGCRAWMLGCPSACKGDLTSGSSLI